MAKGQKFKKIVATTAAGAIVLGSGTAIGAVLTKRHNEKHNPKEREYTVQTGDTLYDISDKYYGTGIYFDDIAEYNGIEDPSHIMPGDTIKLPNIESDKEVQPTTIQTYTVQAGDNLTTICQKIYGDDSYNLALKLAEYNGIEDPNMIKQGQVLELPMYEELQEINVKSK